MVEFGSLVRRISPPVDEAIIEVLAGIEESVLGLFAARLTRTAENLESHYEWSVQVLRSLATSEEEHRELDEYLADKRRTIAQWQSNCRRCHRYMARNLRAYLRGEAPIPNPYEKYWDRPILELTKQLCKQQ